MKRLINILPELFIFFGICFFIVSCDQKLSELEKVSIEHTGISIITYDNHEYLSYRDGSNAASVGGIIHSESCMCKNNE